MSICKFRKLLLCLTLPNVIIILPGPQLFTSIACQQPSTDHSRVTPYDPVIYIYRRPTLRLPSHGLHSRSRSMFKYILLSRLARGTDRGLVFPLPMTLVK